VLFLFNLACGNSHLGGENTEPPSHDLFDALLQQYVDEEGVVDYKGFIRDEEKLDNYLQLVQQHPPDRNTWFKEDFTRNSSLIAFINRYSDSPIDPNAKTILRIMTGGFMNRLPDLWGFPNPEGLNRSINQKQLPQRYRRF